MDEIIAEFINETRDMLDHVSSELVAWEHDPSDRDRLDKIFRFVHTVKGSSGFLNLPRHERLSHAAEDVLGELRSGEREASPDIVSAILAIIDRIGALTDALERDETLDEDDEPLIAALERAGQAEEHFPAAGGQDAAVSVAGASRASSPVRSIRVPVELLDQLMTGVSDLVLSRNEFARCYAKNDTDALELAFERLSSSITDLRDRISWTRMQRIESLFAALPRLVRDVAGQLDKQVALEIDGSDVELDREMVEMLRDPLTHIVRNAIDHGIEAPEQREAAGKTAQGRLAVAARQTGNRIEIAVTDDGGGIDAEAMRQRAVDEGVMTESDAIGLSSEQVVELVFRPGLSTATDVSAISGRGVGMDVVRTNVERLGGTISVESERDVGTTIRLNVPLTLTIMPSLVVGCGEEIFAIPRPLIGEILSLSARSVEIQHVGDSELLDLRGEAMPLVRLPRLLSEGAKDMSKEERFAIVVTPRKGERYALAVDAMIGHDDLVVKPLSPVVMTTGLFVGSALPDTGRPLLLLDVAGIAEKVGLRLAFGSDSGIHRPEDAKREPAASVQALTFEDWDGRRRAMRIGVVERVLKADARHLHEQAGQHYLTLDGEVLPVVATGSLPETGSIDILRLTDGTVHLGYAIAGPADIETLSGNFRAAQRPGRIAGLFNRHDIAIELIDPHALFAEFAEGTASGDVKICRIVGGDEHWRREILTPLVEMSHYRVVFDDEPVEEAVSLVIDADGARASDADESAPILRLSDHAGTRDAIYRYDREAIAHELQRCAKAGGEG